MPDYKELYFHLFGVLADAVDALEDGDSEKAKELLIQAQQQAEDDYLEEDEQTAALTQSVAFIVWVQLRPVGIFAVQ